MPDNQATNMKAKPSNTASAATNADTRDQDICQEDFISLGFIQTHNPEKPGEIEYEDTYSGARFTMVPAPIWELNQPAAEQAISAAYLAGLRQGRESIRTEFQEAQQLIRSLGLSVA